MKLLKISIILFFVLAGCTYNDSRETQDIIPGRWSVDQAMAWQYEHGWLVGSNFTPSTAINQLEFWQAETFDPVTIDRELGWAADIGMNVMRVYLHDLLYEIDSVGFLIRMDKFLEISEKHGIKIMFVLFDDCWYGNPQPGLQPEPVPGLHNSGWVQSPNYAAVMDHAEWPRLEQFTKGVMTRFAEDERIVMWDLYNEPANNHFHSQIFPLVKEVFVWAREVNPSQPLTICCWKWGEQAWPMNKFCLENSDVITFHNYGSYETMAKDIALFQSFERPVLCSEYLARGNNSLIETHLPLMKKHQVGAINWGLVDGKTQTKYPWNHPLNVTEVDPWHHEIFHTDGTPYSQAEVDVIRQLTAE